jgi:hypothetical protein
MAPFVGHESVRPAVGRESIFSALGYNARPGADPWNETREPLRSAPFGSASRLRHLARHCQTVPVGHGDVPHPRAILSQNSIKTHIESLQWMLEDSLIVHEPPGRGAAASKTLSRPRLSPSASTPRVTASAFTPASSTMQATCCLLRVSQIRAVRSWEAVTMRVPSGENVALRTGKLSLKGRPTASPAVLIRPDPPRFWKRGHSGGCGVSRCARDDPG